MGRYREDHSSRCSRCSVRVERADAFMTTDAEVLCPACRRTWSHEQLQQANVHRGPRLVCPSCKLATMQTRGTELSLQAQCPRCNEKTSRLQSLAFLGFAVMVMLGIFATMVTGTPIPLVSIGVFVAWRLVMELVHRSRYRNATYEEIEAADAALKAEQAAEHVAAAQHQARVLEGGLRVAAVDVEAHAEGEAEAEAEAQRSDSIAR